MRTAGSVTLLIWTLYRQTSKIVRPIFSTTTLCFGNFIDL